MAESHFCTNYHVSGGKPRGGRKTDLTQESMFCSLPPFPMYFVERNKDENVPIFVRVPNREERQLYTIEQLKLD